MDKIWRMWGVTLWEKVIVKNKRKDSLECCKINNAIRERDIVSEGE